ncbi:MAG: cellulase family glycosylhydrolase, partial [Chloroflexota bacterium]
MRRIWHPLSVLGVVLALVLAPLVTPGTAQANLGGVVASANRLFDANGRQVFVLGANYVGGPDRSWTMWQDDKFDAGLIDRDFARARAAGVNTVRLFVRPPLQQQLLAGQWSKLDTAVSLAEKHGLYLILTLYDYRDDDLARVAQLDGAIARHYAGRATILAYDLKNEPHYQDLAITRYPGAKPPLQTDALIKHYGERATTEQSEAWRRDGAGKGLVPAAFSVEEAHIYANIYRYYQEFLADAGAWVAARQYTVSTVSYMASPDAAKWQPFLKALDETLAAWLRPRVEALRAADSSRLLTVGYSDYILAALPANSTLSFLSPHRFPAVGLRALQGTFSLIDELRRLFPERPVLFEEFGYSSAEVEPVRGGVYETAILLRLLGQGMAGGAKWSLYDLSEGFSARENNFGLLRADGAPKPLASALRALADYAADRALLPTGSLKVEAEPNGPGVQYVYTAPDALFVAAASYADPAGRLAFSGGELNQVFLAWPQVKQVQLLATASTTLRVNPAALTGLRGLGDLTLVRADGSAVPFTREGEAIVFGAEGGQAYRLNFSGHATDARIEIVWPHDGKPVQEAERANIGAYLFASGSKSAVCPQPSFAVRLWRSVDNGVEDEVVVGEPRLARVDGLAFTAWDFNNVDVAAARDPRHKVYFRLS